jgi:hypothetical protein
LAICKHWDQGQRKLSFEELKPSQELVVFDVGGHRSKVLFQFFSKAQAILDDSPPALNPSAPLVAWYLCRSQILLANFKDGSSCILQSPVMGTKGQTNVISENPR